MKKSLKLSKKNFKSTGLFNPLKKMHLFKNQILHIKPRFEDWRLIKAQALVTGKIIVKNNKLKVEFRLWDLTAAKEMVALSFTTSPQIGEELLTLYLIRFMRDYWRNRLF